MSTDRAIAVIDATLGLTEQRKFTDTMPFTAQGAFQTEKHYFGQLVRRNPRLAEAVLENPASVVTAMLDLAAMGLTLSPTLGYAYMVPQRPTKDGPVEIQCLPSYKGFERVAFRSGIIKSIATELVYENDVFEYGMTIDGPYLRFQMAMGDRGALRLGFCLTKKNNGEKSVEIMTAAELEACQVAAMRGGALPPAWRGAFVNEMRKKCVVRRAAKHWELGSAMEKVLETIDRDVGLTDDVIDSQATQLVGDAEIRRIRDALPELEAEEQDYWMLRKAQAMNYQSIRDVPAAMADKIIEELRKRLENMMESKDRANKEPVGGQGEVPPPTAATIDAGSETPVATARTRRRGSH